ncbi:DUF3748 domain-containing protein [Emticicia oligotrophica]|nr:DUF3748 domain-containing protein [Emticicia oligotrophica]
MKIISAIIILFFTCSYKQMPQYFEEIQLTNDLTYHHDLDNNDNFSPDNQWLVYDTRTDDGGIAESNRIEKVNVLTGEKKVVYQVPNNHFWGPGVGAASYSPVANQIVFIHGLKGVTKENPYQQWRRTGYMIDEDNDNKGIWVDARNIEYPYTKGALRGGTHRHEFSGDGNWIGFTYNDAIMKNLEDKTGNRYNLRTIGISKKGQKIQINNPSNENFSGEWFSALVVKVVPNPKDGSDEISHAAGDSWIGKNGYKKPNGQQQMARGFIGTVKENGENIDEVFVVDIPENIEEAGIYGKLEGNELELPQPPKGASQRRLTFTSKQKYKGCIGIVRASSDGEYLAFVAKDNQGVKQIFCISPNGGKMEQITFHNTDVEGSLRWHPIEKSIFYIQAGSINQVKLGPSNFEDSYRVISKPSVPSPTNLVVSHDAKSLAFNRLIKNTKQVFLINLEK